MLRPASYPRVLVLSALTVGLGALSASGVVSAHQAQPTATTAADIGSSVEPISCPIDGDSEFVDSWGDARSGGRRHKGVDMAAERGTPVIAARSGFAEFKVSNAGGKAIWLTTATGDRFYYAHLDGWLGESRQVRQGEVVGFVGSTGNAGGNHLHFETHPAGTPVNPYPSVAVACAADRIAVTPAR